ncbi:hypothetical protein U27_06093 [Candidatus Vecturithrix granuli]|uniref:ABC transporter substrate binding protein n=1 Tax=Vecturithrix granuli TaxID=1499967 RepID=A0A081C3G2_VECG1|nr:hypothetical protein U27_06093 [Candidatus Vecturithrix granuli]
MKRIVTMSVLLGMVFGMFANVGFAAGMKKVLILSTVRSKPIAAQSGANRLEELGFIDQKTVTNVWVEVSATTDPAQLVAQVKAEAPDVVLSFTGLSNIMSVLEEFAVPVITMTAVESYVNADGIPTANVTGMYSKLQDIIFNSYKFLQQVAPLKPGQQVIFLDNPQMPGIVPKEEVIDALQRLQIPLKAVVNGAIYEDWQQAILQYNDDPEVGWILHGAGPTSKRDGSGVNAITETYPWLQAHLKKPSLSHEAAAVQAGVALCGFSMDLNDVGAQCGELAARILQGEPISAVKAEYPRKVMVALNRKTATNLGIMFSMDVLKLANIIYNDYEGKDVIRK